MIVRDLIKGLEIIRLEGTDKLEIENIHNNSKDVTENSLFVCVQGFKTDGHLYVDEAIKRGARAIICERPLGVAGITMVQVPNSRRAMAQIANRFFNYPSQTLDVIGVTGTNGKTSITYMVKAILEESGRKAGLMGTMATLIGEERIIASRTTPESIEVQRQFRRMLDHSLDSCVMEVSSHSLELSRVEGVNYQVGIFTNLTPDHLDFHLNLDNYREAKKKLFYQTIGGNVINIDDSHGQIIARELRDLKTPLYTYGINGDADFKAENVKISLKGASFDVVGPDFRESFTLKIPAFFAVYNGLAAIAACYVMKVPVSSMIMALQDFKGVRGRFEVIEEIRNITVIVDFAHTPDALKNVLKTAMAFTTNRLISVFGCGGDRDKTKRPVMGEIGGRYSDISILTSDNPRTEDPHQILEMVEAGMKRTQGSYHVIADRREAIGFALKIAQEDDIIIIAGKGHETNQIVGDQVLPFDDRLVAIEIAREEGIE